MNILLRQGSGAPWLVTWPGSVAWVGGSAPTLETAVNAWNWVTLITLDGGTVWFGEAVTASGGGGGAPTTADYLVGTAQGGLSAEIVVGTTPNGELGGTWGAITVDATHSGSAHHTESHQSRHNEAGADELKLDDLGIPDDNTDLNASTSAHGLLPKLAGGTTSFLRADGTYAVPGSGGVTGNLVLIYKTADEVVNNSTTYQDDNHLLYALAATGEWEFELNLWFESGTTPDIKYQMIGPTGLVGYVSATGLNTAGAENDAVNYGFAATISHAGQGIGTIRHSRLKGYIRTTGTSGNLQLQWAQNSLSATDTTLHRGSTLKVFPLA
jgi:hypothetical protein